MLRKAHASLAKERLKHIAAKGKLSDVRRRMGWQSDDSSHDSDSCNPSARSETESDDDDEDDGFFDQDESGSDMLNGGNHGSKASDECSSLDGYVEIGDVACIIGLQSEIGRQFHDRYGKVISYDAPKDRFGVRLQCGRVLSVLSGNLEMGMKAEELSDEDEQLLLGLTPTSEEIRALPYIERMKALHKDLWANVQDGAWLMFDGICSASSHSLSACQV